jgi:hypothetical protein
MVRPGFQAPLKSVLLISQLSLSICEMAVNNRSQREARFTVCEAADKTAMHDRALS